MVDYWDQRLIDAGIIPAPPERIPPLPPTPWLPNGNGYADGDKHRRYGLAALRSEAEALALSPEGQRNHQLNVAVFKLTGLVDAGSLSEEEVTDALTAAARTAGLEEAEITATLRSGRSGSRAKVGARVIPELAPEPEPVVLDAPAADGQAADDAEAERADLHRIAVQRRAYDLRVNDEARDLWTAQRAALMGQLPPPVEKLTDLLAVPDEPAQFRVADLWPMGGRVLLSAQYKAGKTSLMANLLRCLVDGDQFLGRWAPRPVQRVTLLDTELDKDMLRRWLRDQNIRNTGAVDVISLRGRASTFNILDDATRAEWADRIGPTDLVMLDCLRPCLDAIGLSEDKEAGRFLVAFDALCTEAHAAEAFVVHHMGHSEERSRGDSRLLDWPDVLWKIVRDSNDEGEQVESAERYFSAMGRDVNVPEAQLDWTPETRSLMVCGGGRAEKKARSSVADVVEVLSAREYADGLTNRQLVACLGELGVGRNLARRAIKAALDDGVVLGVSGPRNSTIHVLNPSRRLGD